ncbi:MAG: hypothetical protein Q7R97_03755 [Candidatus Daviesbacteria bacterium]|nr:hypothetical protein [Candidatus Daviesbacteria bacterium]
MEKELSIEGQEVRRVVSIGRPRDNRPIIKDYLIGNPPPVKSLAFLYIGQEDELPQYKKLD